MDRQVFYRALLLALQKQSTAGKLRSWHTGPAAQGAARSATGSPWQHPQPPNPRNVPVPEMSLLQKCPLRSPALQRGCHCFVRSWGCLWLGTPLGIWRKPRQVTRQQEAEHIFWPRTPSRLLALVGMQPLLVRSGLPAPAWHLQVVTSPITCHLMQPPQSRESQTCCEQLQLPKRKPQGLRTSNCHCSGQTHPC